MGDSGVHTAIIATLPPGTTGNQKGKPGKGKKRGVGGEEVTKLKP